MRVSLEINKDVADLGLLSYSDLFYQQYLWICVVIIQGRTVGVRWHPYQIQCLSSFHYISKNRIIYYFLKKLINNFMCTIYNLCHLTKHSDYLTTSSVAQWSHRWSSSGGSIRLKVGGDPPDSSHCLGWPLTVIWSRLWSNELFCFVRQSNNG